MEGRPALVGTVSGEEREGRTGEVPGASVPLKSVTKSGKMAGARQKQGRANRDCNRAAEYLLLV